MQREGVCLVGYGETAYVRPKGEDRSPLRYMAEAIRLALDNSGLKKKDVNGLALISTTHPDDSPFVAEQLGMELDWLLRADFGGASAVISARRAADAIQLGQIQVAVCVGADVFRPVVPLMRAYPRVNYIEPFGYGGPNSLFALTQRRHMAQYGTTREQLGKIAVSVRRNAELNEHALFRTPMKLEEYLNARYVSDPVRLFDCVMPCSGAAAFVMTSEARAKQLTKNPIYMVSDGEKSNYRVEEINTDWTVTGLKGISDELFTRVRHEEIDFVEIYDDYPIAILMQLEDLGFCAKGEGGKFVDSHDLTVEGDFPVNTGGGQLSGGQPGFAGGHLHVVEAIRQLKGEAGTHQVKGARTGLVTGIGLLGYNVNLCSWSAMILQGDRAW